MKSIIKAIIAGAMFAGLAGTAQAVSYPAASNSTEPNVWTRNYDGVLAAAQQTGYPIFLIFVGPTCGHCEIMMGNTIRTAAFEEMDKDLVFYKVLVVNGVSSATDSTIMSRYGRYLNGGMFPIVAVLRKDGGVYGAYGNATTDKRGVTAELRDLIEKLSLEQVGTIQHQDGTTSGETAGGETVAPAAPSAAAWAVKLKGKANGVVFDASQNVIGSAVLKIAAKGNVTAKFTLANGRQNLKGEIALNEDGEPYFTAGGLTMKYDTANNVWIGAYNGGVVLASGSKLSGFNGLYTSGAQSADGAKAGYFTGTVKAAKCKLAGLVNGRNKVSATGVGIAVPARVVSAYLPAWDVSSDLAIFPMIKRGVSGGVAISRYGVAYFEVNAAGIRWNAQGQKWATDANMKTLEGKTMAFQGASGKIEVPLVWTGRALAAGANDIKAKFKAYPRKGIFKGSAKVNGARYVIEGALYSTSNGVAGAGVSYGASVSKVTVGDDECDSCVFQ